MHLRLKKNYFSKPAGTIVDVIQKGKDFQIMDKKERMYFALFNQEQKDEYIEVIK